MTAPSCPRCGNDLPRLASAAGMDIDVFVYACQRCEPAKAQAPTLQAR